MLFRYDTAGHWCNVTMGSRPGYKVVADLLPAASTTYPSPRKFCKPQESSGEEHALQPEVIPQTFPKLQLIKDLIVHICLVL